MAEPYLSEFQSEHDVTKKAFADPIVEALLNKYNYTLNSMGNRTGLFSHPVAVAFFESLPDTIKEAIRAKGWGTVQHFGGAPGGGNQLGKSNFEIKLFQDIARAFETGVLTAAQEKVATFDAVRWFKKLSAGEISGYNVMDSEAALRSAANSAGGIKPLAEIAGITNFDSGFAKGTLDFATVITSGNNALEKGDQAARLEHRKNFLDIKDGVFPEELKNLLKEKFADAAAVERNGAFEYAANRLFEAVKGNKINPITLESAIAKFWKDSRGSLDLDKTEAALKYLFEKANLGEYIFKNAVEEYGPVVETSLKSTLRQIGTPVGLLFGADALYLPIKKGLEVGDWTDFAIKAPLFTIEFAVFGLLAGKLIGRAYKVNKVLGAVVAAALAGVTIVAGVEAAESLIKKITIDASEYIELASNEIIHITDSLSDLILDYYGANASIPKPIAPFDSLYVIDNLDPTKPSWMQGTDVAELFFGKNGAVIYGGGGDDQIHHSGSGAVYGEDGGDTILLLDTHGIRVDGGAGNDYILSKNGQGGVFSGGPGRDWFFVKTPGAELYGDTIDGQMGDGSSPTSSSNSDNFWWTPGTSIMDAQKNDVLKFFGIPLVGGTNDIPLIVKGMTSFFGASTGLGLSESPLYFDNFLVFMNYVFIDNPDTGGKDLYVCNIFDGLLNLFTNQSFSQMGDGGSIRGAMRVASYDGLVTYWGAAIAGAAAINYTGDLGMLFKKANPVLAALALLPPIAGLSGAMLSQIDDTFALAGFTTLLVKKLGWAVGVDPLILDLDGDGIETLGIDQGQRWFDFDNDLFSEKTAWLKGDDGFLVLDENGNGRIDHVGEMFGGLGQSGIDELATHDSNHDGKITLADAIWSELRVWRDLDQDTITDEGELYTLQGLGITEINLTKTAVNSVTPQGNTLLDKASFTFTSGGIGNMYDALFRFNDVNSHFNGESGTASWLKSVPIDARGFGSIVDLSVAMSNDLRLGEVVAAASAVMTVPKLKLLRAQAGEALGLWGGVNELSRELTPVRVLTIDGKATLADYGVYHEDASGGFWRLHSGGPVQVSGVTIARATLEDILAQPGFHLEQTFSPSDRGKAVQFREPKAYLVQVVAGRAVVLDVASTADARPLPPGQEWRTEALGFNPYADVPVEAIGVKFVDGKVVDYTVEVTDAAGTFYVWARNLDYAAELQHYTGSARGFNLRNYAVDFATLDEVGSTDDAHVRVELLTPQQFHFATSLGGVDFRPEMLSAVYNNTTGQLSTSVNQSGNISLGAANADYVSGISVMIDFVGHIMEEYLVVSRAFAVRMAMQGGLKDFAAGLKYDVTLDKYVPTQDRELAPMFKAIFESAPTGYDAAQSYLKDWNEILWQIYPDYKPDGSRNQYGATVAVDQPFIMQMMQSRNDNVKWRTAA